MEQTQYQLSINVNKEFYKIIILKYYIKVQ